MEAPEAGLVVVEVAVPGSARVEPRVGLVRGGCGGLAPELLPVSEAPTRLAVAVAGRATFTVRVAAQDRRSRLGSYKVTSLFVTAEELGGEAGWGRVAPNGGGTTGSGEDPSELEIDPDRDTFRPAVCRRPDSDDHADTLTCASPVEPGRGVEGVLRSPAGDDADVFVFRLEELRTVELSAAGGVATWGTLFDGDGHRLAAGGGFRIVKTLAPGLYYLRVESLYGEEGSYRLRFHAFAW